MRLSVAIAHPQNQLSPISVTIPPQTAIQSGSPLQTTYEMISGLTDNSVTTTVLAGSTTGEYFFPTQSLY